VHGSAAALPYWIDRLGHRLPAPRARPRPKPRRPRRRGDHRVRLVVVSHNWNFFGCELASLSSDARFEVRTVWPGRYVTEPVRRTPAASALARADKDHRALFRWADIVLCDWCERPAVWLSRCLPLRTALCVRLHSHEAHSPFPLLVDWRRVSDAIFVADHIREYLDETVRISARVRTTVLAPAHRVADFEGAKRAEARWTLGMIGYNSPRKHPLLALEILAALRRRDRRWRLRLIGHPFGRAHGAESDPLYARAFRRAIAAWGLSESVSVSPFTSNLRPWLSRVGFILSTSEREGTHEGVAQGMSSGAIPVVRRWPVYRSMSAAERRYPTAIHFDTAQEAAAGITGLSRGLPDETAFRACGLKYAEEARRRFDCSVAAPRLAALLLGAAGVGD
jgi:glycosyltransferase involved in cell wall biosynthesis